MGYYRLPKWKKKKKDEDDNKDYRYSWCLQKKVGLYSKKEI